MSDSCFVPFIVSGRALSPVRCSFVEARLCQRGSTRSRQPRDFLCTVRCMLGEEGVAAPTLERRNLSQSQVRQGKERVTSYGPKYRLYIVNDDFNRRERVVEVLLKTVDGLSFASAYASMDEAHKHGKGHVTTVVQELAEHYCELICGQGVLSVIEPDD